MKSLIAFLAVMLVAAMAPAAVAVWILGAYIGFWVLVVLAYVYFLVVDA